MQSMGMTNKVFIMAAQQDTTNIYKLFKLDVIRSLFEYLYAKSLKYSVAPKNDTQAIVCLINTGIIPSNSALIENF